MAENTRKRMHQIAIREPTAAKRFAPAPRQCAQLKKEREITEKNYRESHTILHITRTPLKR